MGYAYLLNTEASLATFRQNYSVPNDVEMAYCHESEIVLHRGAGTAFFPLMSILEGGVRFPIDPLLLNTIRYYKLSPDQLPPNFYWVVSCVSRLNQMFGLQLDQHDINHMYSLCGKKRSNYYLKVRDMRVRLISCRSNSNKNSAREYVRVHGKWFASDVPPLLSWREVGSFRSIVYSPFPFIIVLFTRILTRFLFFFFFFYRSRFSVHPRH